MLVLLILDLQNTWSIKIDRIMRKMMNIGLHLEISISSPQQLAEKKNKSKVVESMNDIINPSIWN